MLSLDTSATGVCAGAAEVQQCIVACSNVGIPNMPHWSGGGDGSDFYHLTAKPNGLFEKVRALCELDKQEKRIGVRRLQESLHNVWRGWCSVVQHRKIPAVTAATKTPLNERVCLEAGKCLCNPRGRATLKILKSINAAVRQQFPKATREPLIGGEVVLLMVGTPLQTCSTGKVMYDFKVSPTALKFVRIADVSLRPWELMYAEYREDGSQAVFARSSPTEFSLGVEVFQLVSSFKEWGAYELPSELHPALRWDLCFLDVLYGEKLIGDFIPNCIEVRSGFVDYNFKHALNYSLSCINMNLHLLIFVGSGLPPK